MSSWSNQSGETKAQRDQAFGTTDLTALTRPVTPLTHAALASWYLTHAVT